MQCCKISGCMVGWFAKEYMKISKGFKLLTQFKSHMPILKKNNF